MTGQPWRLGHRYSRQAAQLADRHYNRQTPGSPQFSPPGRLLVLLAPHAVWTSVLPEHARHAWAGAVNNALFRREPACPFLASDLIRAAVAATHAWLGEPPAQGMVTFVDPGKVRHKRDPGRCYRRAGFEPVGSTKERGLLVLWLPPHRWPDPLPAAGTQATLL